VHKGSSKLRQSIARSSNADLEEVVNNDNERSSLVPKQSSNNSLSNTNNNNFASLLSNPANQAMSSKTGPATTYVQGVLPPEEIYTK
jgi:hypothetical protein